MPRRVDRRLHLGDAEKRPKKKPLPLSNKKAAKSKTMPPKGIGARLLFSNLHLQMMLLPCVLPKEAEGRQLAGAQNSRGGQYIEESCRLSALDDGSKLARIASRHQAPRLLLPSPFAFPVPPPQSRKVYRAPGAAPLQGL